MYTYTKVFRDPNKLNEMISLRLQGVDVSTLARRYGVDHTSILYWCRKRNIVFNPEAKQFFLKKREERLKARPRPFSNPIKPYIDERGEKINPGKSYQEYLLEEKKKHHA